jgi:hypothetical protein
VDASRIVIGYHGCARSLAVQLLSGNLTIWRPSTNPWDWLGHGIYFWEWDAGRALRWAREKYAGRGEAPAVIGAVIQLDRCFDLTNERFTRMLAIGHEQLERDYRAKGESLPRNTGGEDRPRRELDCLVINTVLERTDPPRLFTSIRAPFLEGAPAYPGAMIRQYTHIQIAVRDSSCVLGIFVPNLSM